jgi:hypothetical protein
MNKVAVQGLLRGGRRSLKLCGASAAAVAIVVLLMSFKTPVARAGDGPDNDESKIRIGYAIAPVPLNVQGKNRALVGLGSYIVNANADCNGCHSHGPQTEYLPTGNAYFLKPPNQGKEQINPATYLGGGRDFGPFANLAHLYSRNLTPDKTGRAAGGLTYWQFITIMRTGKDYDGIHPSCTGAPDGTCLVAPFNGALLQVMPWPVHRHMTDRDLHAIYEYLSSIPCIDTVVDGAPYLRNECQ